MAVASSHNDAIGTVNLGILLRRVARIAAILRILALGPVPEAAVDAEFLQATTHSVTLAILPTDQCSRTVHLEAVDARRVALVALVWDEGRVDLEDDIVKGAAKVGAVNRGVPRRLWVVQVFAARAVQLHRLLVRRVALSHGQQRMRVTHDPGTLAEFRFLVLFELSGM